MVLRTHYVALVFCSIASSSSAKYAEPAGKARAMADSAYALTDTDPERCRAIALRTLSVARQERDDVALHDALNALRYVHYLRHETADLLRRSTEALEVARRIDNHRAIGDDLNWISLALQSSGQNEEAYQRSLQALEHMRLSKDSTALANGLCDLATACGTSGRTGEAIMHVREALRIYEALGDEAGAAFAMNNLAAQHMERHRWADALPYLQRAYRYTGLHGEEIEKAYLERDIGHCSAELGQFEEAHHMLDRAETRIQHLGVIREIPLLLSARMALARKEGHDQEALGFALRSLALSDSLNTLDLNGELAHAMERFNEGEMRQEIEDLKQRIAAKNAGADDQWWTMLIWKSLAIGALLGMLAFGWLAWSRRNARAEAA